MKRMPPTHWIRAWFQIAALLALMAPTGANALTVTVHLHDPMNTSSNRLDTFDPISISVMPDERIRLELWLDTPQRLDAAAFNFGEYTPYDVSPYTPGASLTHYAAEPIQASDFAYWYVLGGTIGGASPDAGQPASHPSVSFLHWCYPGECTAQEESSFFADSPIGAFEFSAQGTIGAVPQFAYILYVGGPQGDVNLGIQPISIQLVPEPSTGLLLNTGLLGLAARRRSLRS